MLSNGKQMYELWILRLHPHSNLYHLGHNILCGSPTPDFIPCQPYPTSPKLYANQPFMGSHTGCKAAWPLAASSMLHYNPCRAILIILNQLSPEKVITGKPLVCIHAAYALWHAKAVREFSFAIHLVWIWFPSSLSAIPAVETGMGDRKHSSGNKYHLLFAFQKLHT